MCRKLGKQSVLVSVPAVLIAIDETFFDECKPPQANKEVRRECENSNQINKYEI
jgi:hypothetical protein